MHLQIHRRIKNPAKRLKWSKKELAAKIIIAWKLPDRDLNIAEFLNMSEF